MGESMKERLAAAIVGGAAATWIRGAGAQGQTKANWLMDGYDSGRTSWQRNETQISTATAKNMKLLWTLQLDNQPRQMHNLFPPLIVGSVNTAAGPREVAVVAGVSDNIYGIDVERGT